MEEPTRKFSRSEEKRTSRMNSTSSTFSPERPHVIELTDKIIKFLEKNNCDDIVGMEVEDVSNPFYMPSVPVIVETNEMSRTKALYKYVRKIQKQEEKIRLRFMNISSKNEIEGLFISGLLVDYPLFKVVVKLLTFIETLKVLRLVDCSLKKEGIIILGKLLGKTRVTHLYLDRNPVPDQNYHCILKKNSVLQHLSLVQCHIDKKGAQLLGRMLGPPTEDKPSHYLKSLNINNNHLDCISLKYLSQGLKWNRDLLFLSMAGNRIGNAGIEYLSKKALQENILENWEKELKEKRLIRREEEVREMVDNLLYNTIDEMNEQEERDNMNEGEDSGYEDMIRRERMIQEYIKNDSNPLSCDVFLANNGKYIAKGNRTLRGLNISYNKIDEFGFTHLLNALRYQNEQRQSLTKEERMNFFLMSINLMGNFCPEKCKVLKKIKYYIRKFIREEPEDDYEQEEEESVVDENEAVEESEEIHDEVQPEEVRMSHESQIVVKQGRRRILKSFDEVKVDETMIDFENLLTVVSESTETDEIETPSEDSIQDSTTKERRINEHSIVNESDSED